MPLYRKWTGERHMRKPEDKEAIVCIKGGELIKSADGP